MYTSTLASLVLLASSSSSVLAAPHKLTSSNSTDSLVLPFNSTLPKNVTDTAGGNAPDAPLPAHITDLAIAQFWIANFLENLEASFFETGVKNLTEWGTDGYPAGTLEVVRKVAAQERVHVTTLTSILSAYNHPSLQPCTYRFPVSNTSEFLALAQTITTVGIGAVLDIAATLALIAPLLLPSLTSIVTVEARHDAFFRSAGANLVPNPSPFDTRISTTWALNLVWGFVVPGSCPVGLEFPWFPPLVVVASSDEIDVGRRCGNEMTDGDAMSTPATDKITTTTTTITTTTLTTTNTNISSTTSVETPDPTITFTISPPYTPYLHLLLPSSSTSSSSSSNTSTPFLSPSPTPLYIAWLNQANSPVYTEASIGQGTVATTIPPGMSGMAFAVLTAQNWAWNVTGLTEGTLAGPVVVRVS